jgi:hypothetical protein
MAVEPAELLLHQKEAGQLDVQCPSPSTQRLLRLSTLNTGTVCASRFKTAMHTHNQNAIGTSPLTGRMAVGDDVALVGSTVWA